MSKKIKLLLMSFLGLFFVLILTACGGGAKGRDYVILTRKNNQGDITEVVGYDLKKKEEVYSLKLTKSQELDDIYTTETGTYITYYDNDVYKIVALDTNLKDVTPEKYGPNTELIFHKNGYVEYTKSPFTKEIKANFYDKKGKLVLEDAVIETYYELEVAARLSGLDDSKFRWPYLAYTNQDDKVCIYNLSKNKTERVLEDSELAYFELNHYIVYQTGLAGGIMYAEGGKKLFGGRKINIITSEINNAEIDGHVFTLLVDKDELILYDHCDNKVVHNFGKDVVTGFTETSKKTFNYATGDKTLICEYGTLKDDKVETRSILIYTPSTGKKTILKDTEYTLGVKDSLIELDDSHLVDKYKNRHLIIPKTHEIIKLSEDIKIVNDTELEDKVLLLRNNDTCYVYKK